MTDTLVGGWWEGSADRNLAISTWNRLDHSLARPVERQLFDTDDVLIEPLRTLRKVAMALALGDPAVLQETALSLNMTDMRLLLAVKHKYPLGQLTSLFHASRDEVLDRSHRLVTELAHTVLYERLEGLD